MSDASNDFQLYTGNESTTPDTSQLQSSDLPTQSDPNALGSSGTVAAGQSTVGLTNDTTLSGVLNVAKSTGDSLLNYYTQLTGVKAKIQQTEFNNQVATATFGLQKTVALGNLAVQQTQAQGQISQAMAQASKNAALIAPTTKSGIDWTFLFGAIGAGVAIWTFVKGRKA